MTMPSIEQAKQALREADVEQAYWDEHGDELVGRYREQFVAVKDGGVVAVANDLTRLISALKEKHIDIRDTWVRYLTDDYTKYLL